MTDRMTARTVSCAGSCELMSSPFLLLPAALAAAILFLEPARERLEILRDRGRVHLARAGQFLERVLPRLARAERQHFLVPLAGFLAAEHRALVQRALEARGLAQRLV